MEYFTDVELAELCELFGVTDAEIVNQYCGKCDENDY